jgi:hypothetical protein
MTDQNGPKGVVDMRPERHGGRVIDPKAAAAEAYAAGMAARAQQRAQKAQTQKYAQPVGGAPTPSIPRLDQEAAKGAPMAAQAETANAPTQHEVMQQMARQASTGSSIVEPPVNLPGAPPKMAQQALQAGSGIAPNDMLPAQAQEDPAFQQGAGAMFAANQPHLAAKYGVIRNGQHIPPQQLVSQAQPGSLSPASIQGLQALQGMNRVPEGMPRTEEEAESQAAAGAASQSARIGKPPGDPDMGEKVGEDVSPEDEKKVQEAINKMDSFDYDSLRRQMSEDMLNSPEQKKIIESRLTELDIDDLIMKNRVTQDVIIHPERLWFTFESMTGEEDLTLKRLIMQESKSIEVTGQYLLDKFAFMSIAVGLRSICANPLPDHRNEKGEFDDKKFWIKFHWLLQQPLHLLSCIGINHTWFELRVRKMFVVEKLGNG